MPDLAVSRQVFGSHQPPTAALPACRCQETEEKRLQDAELLTSVNLELTKLRETHVTTCNTVVSALPVIT